MTGLQFAVLRAYAASLPRSCKTRAALARLLWEGLPRGEQRRAGRILAHASGLMLKDGRTLTPLGRRAALDYLPRLGLPGEEGTA